jgi:hypothetical protein
MQLSKITASCIIASALLQAENYVSVEYLQYDESDSRVSVSAPSVLVSYDIGTDYNIKADFVHDAVSGATPSWQTDSGSGASSRDDGGDYTYENQAFDEERNGGSVLLTTRFANRDELYTGIDFSRESDFDSKTVSVEYMHYTDKSHNRSVSAGLSYGYNEILSYEYDTGSGASEKETASSINAEIGLNQVLDAKSSVKVAGFVVLDDGYLTNPHASVIRDYNSEQRRQVTENRPDTRLGYGADIKYIRMVHDEISYQFGYRLYDDDWGITSHTINNDLYYKLNDKLTLGAGLRYYTQSEADFYNGSKDFFTDEEYASSDERLSDFDALTYRASVDFKQNDKVSYNLGGQFYTQSTGVDATMITVGVKYKF